MPDKNKPLTWPSPNEWPKGHHDAPHPELPEVKTWIGNALGASPTNIHLINCFGFNSWAITARFRIGGPNEEVIFKAVLLDLFSKHPLICELLQQCCPQAVAEMITYREEQGGHWALFRSVSGKSVKEIGDPDLLVKMAKTMATVQINFANLQDERIGQLPRFGNDRLPEMLDFLIKRISDYYLPVWETAGGAVIKRNNQRRIVEIPENFVARLENNMQKIETWAKELKDGNWPESIHHTDYHPGNTIVEPDGNLRIIDWDRAVMSFPFNSIGWLNVISSDEEWQNTSDKKQIPEPSLVDVYLDEIPWNNRVERVRAWDLMNRIGGVADAYESEQLNDALHLKNRTSGNIALLLTNALKEWEAVTE